jgi:hypothetical protein
MINFDPTGKGLERVGLVNDSGDVHAHMGRNGFAPRNAPIQTREHRIRVLQATRMMNDAIQGRLDPFLYRQAFSPTNSIYINHLNEAYPGLFKATRSNDGVGLRETMSYSDYSALTVDILDRALYQYYTAAPITNMPLVKKVPLRDFRLVARYAMDGATTPWSQQVPPTGTPQAFPTVPHGAGEPPTQRAMQQAAREVLGSSQRITYQPQLYQGGMSVNWRALVNDDLGIFQDQTNRLAIGGRRTIYQYITSLYVDSNGPHATLYNSTFGNLINIANGASKNNPQLDFNGLLDAIAVIEKMCDIDGQPITFDGTLYLWYGPALHTTAMALLNKLATADISIGGGTTNAQGFPSQRLRVDTQYVTQNMKPIQDKYIPKTCTTAGVKDTMWGLMYEPALQGRPALELGFLTGYDSPQLFQKVPNTMRVGGGVDPMMGDFYTMDQEFKGCLVMGGTQVDGRSTVASTGQNQ